MGTPFGPGPVFEAECLTASRRIQFYSARVLLLVGLLVGLSVVWVSRGTYHGVVTIQELASIGRSFYMALMGVELCLALMLAPAATAGAICQDRSKGGLALLMTTELSDSEIVLGRLASRLLSTLGVIACGLPVLALATLLGGVDPVAVAGGTLVVVGVACLSVGMALTFSLWAGKAHEALSATYAVWAIWMLALLTWDETLGRSPFLLQWSNPFWLLFSGTGMPSDRLLLQVGFFAACLAATAGLAALSTWKLRSVTLARQGRPSKARTLKPLAPRWLRAIGQAAPSLDDDPILWREWHRKRPSAFGLAIWWTYVILCSVFTVCGMFGLWIGAGVNGFQFSIGLLLACVGAASALSEERSQGSLDVVLATPLDSHRIVMGKWWGAFRIIPRLAILPGLLLLICGFTRGGSWTEGLMITGLVVGLMLAYGAIITGLGLVIAIFQPRQGRAVALMVAAYLSLTVAFPAVALPMMRGHDLSVLSPSPFFGLYLPTAAMTWPHGPMRIEPIFWFGLLIVLSLIAFGLLMLALWSFDRGLGRVVDRRPATPGKLPEGIEEKVISGLSA